MTVLVDGATWQWRGERWAHLASDTSRDELHAFAALLGLRRLAFQGDHYDVPARVQARAVDLGAQVVTSRELVRRLRAAGLRRSPHASPPHWACVLVADAGAYRAVSELERGLVRTVGPGLTARFAPALAVLFGAVPVGDAAITAFLAPGWAAMAADVPGPVTEVSVPPGASPLIRHVTVRGDRSLVELLAAVPPA
jgi:hypothetical protein